MHRPSQGSWSSTFALGFLLVAGWTLHDAAVFVQSGRPALVLALLLPSLAFALAGGALALLLTRSRPLPTGFAALCAALSLLPLVRSVALPRAVLWLPRAALLLTLAGALVVLLRRRDPRLSLPTLALSAGLLACLAKTLYRHGWLEASTPVVAGLVLALGSAWSARPALRRAGAVLGLLVALLWIGQRIRPSLSPSRPDLPPPSAAARDDAPDLLLIVLDTVRADHLGCYGYRRDTTPHLDARVERDFTRFDSARSTSSWTLPSHASLFTGLLPAEHGSSHSGLGAQPLRPEVRTLAQRLRDVGYRTAGIPANQVYLHARFGLDQGFEHFDDRRGGNVRGYLALAQTTGRLADVGHVVYRDATTITDLALGWLSAGQRPSFLFLNYMEAHEPYLPPDRYRNALEEGGPVDPLRPTFPDQELLYDRELCYLDAELERLFDTMERAGLYDRTTIVITSDHGEGLGDHGLYFHGHYLFEELIRVPLLIKPAGGRTRAQDDTPISGAELHDLILVLLGLAPDGVQAARFVASEFYSNQNDQGLTVHEERSGLDLGHDFVTWLEGSLKLIVGSNGSVVAYDLAVDPGERDPLELAPARVEAALRRAARWWAAHPTQPLFEEQRSRAALADLEALGY